MSPKINLGKFPDVVIQPGQIPIPGGSPDFKKLQEEVLQTTFKKYWDKIKGSPGTAISGLEEVKPGLGFCIHYQNGSIYYKQGVMAYVKGAILARYKELGGPTSWLGFPIQDEAPFDDGRVSLFEHGNIYWWSDLGAIDLKEVAVSYTGFHCFGETDEDQLSDSDEPYVVFGVITPTETQPPKRTPIYDDVDAGESRADNAIEIYRGKPFGISISVVVMEYDEGDPDKYKAELTELVSKLSAQLATAACAANPTIGCAGGALLVALSPAITEAINSLLDLGDDKIGVDVVNLSPKDLIRLATRTPLKFQLGVPCKLETGLISGLGASYKVCLTVDAK
ncbi:LGFP repeat-containing protein [Gottfriedia sp. NPDC056225]|uniref:LGFP repeat-containing protein n=1 Tax=Gottfriedia sp. NPDC056225 TaxID=3345751 RepID=UPI001559281E|nr:hypothetical protein HPK19_04300 [Arthrobacter citreus]